MKLLRLDTHGEQCQALLGSGDGITLDDGDSIQECAERATVRVVRRSGHSQTLCERHTSREMPIGWKLADVKA